MPETILQRLQARAAAVTTAALELPDFLLGLCAADWAAELVQGEAVAIDAAQGTAIEAIADCARGHRAKGPA